MSKGRRGFLSATAKLASAGGAALLLPRDALSEISKSGNLREATEEVYVEESFELSKDEIIKLLARVKELEAAIANPPFFNGRHGEDGRDGRDGRDGYQGPKGDQGVQGFSPELNITTECTPYGEEITLGTSGNQSVTLRCLPPVPEFYTVSDGITTITHHDSFTEPFTIPTMDRIEALEKEIEELKNERRTNESIATYVEKPQYVPMHPINGRVEDT